MRDEVSNNPHVYFDLKFGKSRAGRVLIELFKDIVPKSVENFRALCTGEKGLGTLGKPLHYKGTKFHRVVPLCMAQGGDIVNHDGTGGESIYGPTFEDENFKITHEQEGLVGMVNNGPHTNQSQFYITTVPCTHLDGTNVVVGKVVKGLNIVIEMAEINRENDVPLEDIVIENCGEIKPGEFWNIEENDGTEDVYPPWPNDWNVSPDKKDLVEKAIDHIKDSGNHFYSNGNYINAERKYIKTLRYIDWYLSENKNTPNDKIRELRVTLMLNLAAAKLKRNKNKDVVNLCNMVIFKNSNSGKAYYRRGQAKLALKDYDQALEDLHMAITLHPHDKNILSLLDKARKTKLLYLKKERKAFATLFK